MTAFRAPGALALTVLTLAAALLSGWCVSETIDQVLNPVYGGVVFSSDGVADTDRNDQLIARLIRGEWARQLMPGAVTATAAGSLALLALGSIGRARRLRAASVAPAA